MVLETGSDLSVELGIFGGRACIAMGLAHAQMGYGNCVGVDPWSIAASLEGENHPDNDEWWSKVNYKSVFSKFVGTVLALDLWDKVKWMHEKSEDAVRFFRPSEKFPFGLTFGVIHQDSNHSELVSVKEVYEWLPYLQRGGYWVLDDADWSHTQKAIGILSEQLTMVEDHGSWIIFRNDK